MSRHTQKHDTFIRAIMGNQQVALDYFRTCLPQNIQDTLDFSTLRQLPDTYVSKDLQKSISDIIYTCRKADATEEVKIALLVEHKSYIDKYTPIQMGSYLFSGFLKQIGNGEAPSLIIPILLYHGKARWEYKTLADLFNNPEPALKGFVPDYQYIFHNLGEIPDEEIQALHNKFLAASLLAMKYSVLKDRLKSLIPAILKLPGETEKNLQNSLIVYTFVNSGLNQDQIFALITSLPIQNQETVMDTLEIFVEKGRREKTENAVKNLIKQSLLTDEQIASAMEVTVSYVSDIRKNITAEK
ncbi:Rpn family recombination-promoting nuclease/putative transposase [Dyadobacter sp. CY347]|uniref:Rpn family recombination-promoting nuclease/putative transposase n=1 Tax=Dyadobacter sp. CY347 TaxID=2909336 RepID=UPI001F1A5F4D|nr:Rpn family recombination-promoting nuclease/putative transposase [Dyadobacter sp. CY347]MCF2489187.1 Rpn family recombination-promoting nuclease/putative transposase [Dyadobacter sp. CY347]